MSSCLDYCNALFTSLDKSSLSCLQTMQNGMARLPCSSKQAHIAHFFLFKSIVFTLNREAVVCLPHLLLKHTAIGCLWSQAQSVVPHTSLNTKGGQSLSDTGTKGLRWSPTTTIQLYIPDSVDSFKMHLQTCLSYVYIPANFCYCDSSKFLFRLFCKLVWLFVTTQLYKCFINKLLIFYLCMSI